MNSYATTKPHDPPTPYNILSLGAAGGRLAPTLPAVIPGSIVIGRPEFLPLNLIAHILTYLEDDPPTLAALCRTRRLLYYMALPLLWKHVTLRTCNSITRRKRTCDGSMKDVPEGIGGASPFAMGLNALVTHPNVGKLVRRIRLEGDYSEGDGEAEKYSRVGMVSENAMMLNICVRAAVDKCCEMEEFNWDIGAIRLMPTVYQGLSALKNLQSLHVRMPSLRAPQPTTEIPPMRAVRQLTITEYDPLCFPDDVSNLIYEAQQLEDLQVHFSPRMRESGEPSVQLTHLMRKNIMHERKLTLRRLGVYNFFGKPEAELTTKAANIATVEEFTSINSFGKDEGDLSDLSATFVDHGWVEGEEVFMPHLRVWRVDQLHRGHLRSLRTKKGLEKIYLINARHGQPNGLSPQHSSSEMILDSPPASTNSSGSLLSKSKSPNTPAPPPSLKELYLDTICKFSGATLRHLILPNCWILNSALVAKLIRACPNLVQLSACIDCSDMEFAQILLPFLRGLRAVRVEVSLGPRNCNAMTPEERDGWLDTDEFTDLLAELLSGEGYDRLKWLGMGQRVWEATGWEEVDADEGQERTSMRETWDREMRWQQQEGTKARKRRRVVRRIALDDVRHVAIWRMDSLDVI